MKEVKQMINKFREEKNKLNLGGENCSHGGVRQNAEMWL